MSKRMNNVLGHVWTLGKLGITGGIIAGIAFSFGVFDPNLEVQESEADIIALDFAEASPRAKFEDSLKRLGHDEPRPFNLNGNVVFFSSAESNDDPRRVMERYQREFYENDLNSEVFLDVTDENNEKIMLEGQTGGIVPMVVTDDYILLGGMELAKNAESADDLMAIYEDHDPDAPWDMYKAYRHIEIMKTERNTIIASSWSDDDFNYEKMMVGNKEEGQNVSREVPSCQGCVRLNAFEDIGGKKLYRSDAYAGTSSPADLAQFYDRALQQRGWEPTEATLTFDKVRRYADFEGEEAVMRQYARGAELMTVLAYPDDLDDFSVVHTVHHD